MPAPSRSLLEPQAGFVALLGLLALASCSPSYELLKTLDAGGGGTGAGSEAGGSDAGGTGAGGYFGGTSSGGLLSGSGGYSGEAGSSTLGGSASGGSSSNCAVHAECGAGSVCSNYSCVPCPSAPTSCAGPCDYGFLPMLLSRNGCALCECVPPSQCSSSADCLGGEVCYAGAQCEDACSDPSCCYGNQCSAPGCNLTPPPFCLAVGCAGGGKCLAACDTTSCECDGASWSCAAGSTGGGPSAPCAQACAPP